MRDLSVGGVATPAVDPVEPADRNEARAPWKRPSFRKSPARDAEVGVNTISDGSFTTS